ncbi:MAG: glycerol kinase GlpK [Chloroflexi bacterium]|nr:glycerol kinase GlpK [Chloroflexota bacterium]MBU1746629.1 glycerol kinase GlpK [Chloroflexota bacterium]MBU1879342.1 glycerol kinase GlpK [Chloroflexota bacterium]
MTRTHILALDQGTTSSRALVFDSRGRIVGVGQHEFTQHYPQPGWVEHDADEIWQTTLRATQGALAQAGLTSADIAAIGITNQRETTVLWDRTTGEPVHRAIVWQCRRTAPLCDELKAAGHEALFRERTGLVIDAYFSGTKVRWLLDHVPGLRARAEAGRIAFGTIDTWLIWKLTGGRVHATDYSNASRTLLFNIHTLDWDDDILRILHIPRALLPEARPSSGDFGETVELNDVLSAGIPVAGVAGDQQAALFGQAAFWPGMVKTTYGTGAFLLMNTGEQAVSSEHGLLATIAWGLDSRVTYALEGSVFIAGAVIQWLRDGLRIIDSAADTEALARSVPDTGGVYLVPAFVGLGAPHWDMYARGLLVGLTRGTERPHIVRAALEAIAYQVRDVVDAMSADAGLPPGELRADGGAVRNDFLMQFQADVLGIPVVRPVVTETTGLGAATLAGLAVGLWRSTDDLAKLWRADRRFEPQMPPIDRNRLYAGWQRALERAKGWEA